MSDVGDELARLNKETAKILWSELQKFYAQGLVICVAPDMDLIKVAAAFSQDDKRSVETWLEAAMVFHVKDEDAIRWLEQDPVFWAVVVAPWVLVQKIGENAVE